LLADFGFLVVFFVVLVAMVNLLYGLFGQFPIDMEGGCVSTKKFYLMQKSGSGMGRKGCDGEERGRVDGQLKPGFTG